MGAGPLESPVAPTRNAWDIGPWVARLSAQLDRPGVVRAALMAVLLLAALFRFNNLGWDDGLRLHPDERFLITVTNDLTWPESFDSYFDPTASTLSPYALPDMGLYVYGTLPVYLVKLSAKILGITDASDLLLLGRAISALFDLGAIWLLFLVGRRLYGPRVGLLAATLLALSVLNIQLAHFYTVDTFANFFIVATVLALLRASADGRLSDYALAGVMFGLGLASKISVATLAVPVLLAAGLDLRRRLLASERLAPALEQTAVRLLTTFVLAALLFRVVQPIAFAGPDFWNWSLNPQWREDIAEQGRIVAGDADLPWLQQWTDRPASFALANIVLWGLGLPLGLAGWAGFVLMAYELIRHRRLEHLIPVVFVAVTFVYHAATFVKFMRYFLPIYPFLALMAAYLLAAVWRWARATAVGETRARQLPPWLRPTPAAAAALLVVVVGGTLLYATAFSSIYGRPHTRVEASRWMYANIPPGSVLANEHWDDWLPIGGVDGKTAYGDNGMFRSVDMRNYESDTPEKLDQMVGNLSEADYIILSSNRLVDSIPRLPLRYPLTIRYYELLLAEQLGFERVAEFSSYPRLFGIAIPDQSAEEAFTVYDHPRVQIFQKTAAFDPDEVRRKLGEGVAWDAVLPLTPRQASLAPDGLLLTPAEQQAYRETARWSSAGVGEGSWGSAAPVVAWALAVLLIGVLALPLTFLAFGRLADRGYGFAKALGLLLAGWGVWALASLRVAPFTFATVAIVLAPLAVLLGVALRARGAELAAFLRASWRLLLLEEVVFWLCFALALGVRWRNPDLWHPSLGGEKPMDLAYLTAVVRTPYFPPYDPWFAGGFINYYYFGFVLVATLIHLTGIAPHIAYNLAVPLFFALTAAGAFSAAYNLAHGWRQRGERGDDGATSRGPLLAGAMGALFVAVLGNLGQVKLLWDGVRGLSALRPAGEAPASVVMQLAQFGDGLARLAGGARLNLRTEWWYWNASRLIPGGPGEAGPINEMPVFTFLFADLHAHLMALPFTVLAVAFAVAIVHEPAGEATPWWRDWPGLLTRALLALTLGALWPLNTWDVPTYIALAGAALLCREYARHGRLTAAALWGAAAQLAAVVILARLLFLPFHASYAGAYFAAELWRGSRTPLWAYLLVHGLFLFLLGSYLVLELTRGTGHNALARTFGLSLRRWRRFGRARRLFARLVRPTPVYSLALALLEAALAVVLVLVFFSGPAALALTLSILTALLLLSPRPEPRRQLALCMIGLGLVLTALVEFVVLKGDISRMNTVFKFYLQVWVLWGIAAAAVLPWVLGQLRAGATRLAHAARPLPELPEGSVWTPETMAEAEAHQRVQRRLSPSGWWRWAFGALLAAAALYPLTAVPVRIGDRIDGSAATTLDGTAYMRAGVYRDQDQELRLEWDRQATEWLRANAAPLSTVLEANTPLYRWGGRVSIYTGLPAVIGWDWHQKQQRAALPGQLVDRRIEDVRAIYTTADADAAERLLRRYGVRYIYLGPLERIYYPGEGLAKFEREQGRRWDRVYENEQVQIYAVR